MSFKSKAIVTFLAIVGFDAIASLLSSTLQFDYANVSWVSFIIYVVVGFWGAHRQDVLHGILLGAFAGLVDSTAGLVRLTNDRSISANRHSAVASVGCCDRYHCGYAFGIRARFGWRISVQAGRPNKSADA